MMTCAACGQKGHWAGDDECPKRDQSKPKGAIARQVTQRGRIAMGKGKSQPRGKKRPEQGFFVLDDAAFEEGEAFTVRDSLAEAVAAPRYGVGSAPEPVNDMVGG